MLRYFFLLIVVVHGLIHLMGFVKAVNPTLLPQLALPISKVSGGVWLLTSSLFLVSALTFLWDKNYWWIIGLVAILLSQVLVIVYWKDAKFGTLANVILLIAGSFIWGSWSFDKMAKSEINALFKNQSNGITITQALISQQPHIIQKWLSHAQVIGKTTIQTVNLKQKGEMRIQPEGRWMPVEAEQWIAIDEPGFVWVADVKAAPFIHLAGRDKYAKGHGHMLILLLSLYPVADTNGNEIDQATLLRYLSEIIWYPSAALSSYITWEETSPNTAKATMNYGGVSASGTFTFYASGAVKSFEASRYYDRKTGPTLEDWHIAINGNSFQVFGGIQIPTQSTVTWKLEEGDFTWYKLSVEGIRYNFVE